MKAFRPDDRPTPVQEKFATTCKDLSAALIERDDEIDLVLTALVAREHPLLVGPPGTAKALLLDSLMGWMGGKKFTILLTKFFTPEESQPASSPRDPATDPRSRPPPRTAVG